MPCPPSWEERELMQLDYVRSRTEAELAPRARELATMRAVLVALLEHKPLAETPSELEEAFTAVSDIRPELPLPTYAGPRATYPEQWPSMEDVRRVDAEVKYRARLLVRIDLAACVFGCAIARIRAEHGATADASLNARVDEALALHRAHREKERDAAIATLEHQLARDMDKIATEARIERLRALDEATLLGDRLSIHR